MESPGCSRRSRPCTWWGHERRGTNSPNGEDAEGVRRGAGLAGTREGGSGAPRRAPRAARRGLGAVDDVRAALEAAGPERAGGGGVPGRRATARGRGPRGPCVRRAQDGAGAHAGRRSAARGAVPVGEAPRPSPGAPDAASRVRAGACDSPRAATAADASDGEADSTTHSTAAASEAGGASVPPVQGSSALPRACAADGNIEPCRREADSRRAGCARPACTARGASTCCTCARARSVGSRPSRGAASPGTPARPVCCAPRASSHCTSPLRASSRSCAPPRRLIDCQRSSHRAGRLHRGCSDTRPPRPGSPPSDGRSQQRASAGAPRAGTAAVSARRRAAASPEAPVGDGPVPRHLRHPRRREAAGSARRAVIAERSHRPLDSISVACDRHEAFAAGLQEPPGDDVG